MSALRHFLDGPRHEKSRLKVSLPWREIRPPRPDNSVLEIFGEMEFRERNSRLGSASPSPASTPLSISPPPLLLPDSTFNLTQEIEENLDLGPSDIDLNCGRSMCIRCNPYPGSWNSGDGYPPPISIIGKNGKPWLYYVSVKSEGRFVLKEVRIPGQGCMQSTRENGRLLLHLSNPNISNV